jgi:hypothetical protein
MTTPTQTPAPEKITAAELRQLFQALKQQLNERLDGIEEDLAALREGLAAAATASPLHPEGVLGSQPQATPAPAGQTVDFMANTLLVGIDDNGQPTYKAKGGQYAKFGVRIWPEVLPPLGIDPAALKPGPNPINLHVLALMGEKGPRKVIGLTK